MSKKRPEKVESVQPPGWRRFTEEFKAEGVQMVLHGHSVGSVRERLGWSSPTALYRWRRQLVRQGGVAPLHDPSTSLRGLRAIVR